MLPDVVEVFTCRNVSETITGVHVDSGIIVVNGVQVKQLCIHQLLPSESPIGPVDSLYLSAYTILILRYCRVE